MPPTVLPKPTAALPLALSVALVLAGVTGCGEDAPAADPSPSASSTSASTPSAPTSPTEVAPTDPTGAPLPFPDVEPATGLALREQSVGVVVPEGWRANEEVLSIGSGSSGGPGESILLSDQEAFGVGLEAPSLDEQARIALDAARGSGGTYERLPDVELDGVPVLRIAGTTSADRHFEQLTVQHEGRLVTLTFEVAPGTMRDQPDLVESVLNTWRWR